MPVRVRTVVPEVPGLREVVESYVLAAQGPPPTVVQAMVQLPEVGDCSSTQLRVPVPPPVMVPRRSRGMVRSVLTQSMEMDPWTFTMAAVSVRPGSGGGVAAGARSVER